MSKSINVYFEPPWNWKFTTSGSNETNGKVTVDAGETTTIKYPLTSKDNDWTYKEARVSLDGEKILSHSLGHHGESNIGDGMGSVAMQEITDNCITIVVDNSNSGIDDITLSVELVVINDEGMKHHTPDPQIVLPPQNPEI